MICKSFAYRGLMDFFEEISSIPRPTFQEGKIADYLCEFATQRGLEFYRDELNNVLIKKEGTKKRKNEAPILLQGHTDMVCEKNEGVEHNFLCEGLELYEDNGWLRAKGTTLGADDGVAVAIMLYVLDGAEGKLSTHPPIECLFTASEEVGLSGASGFDYSKISARRMINLDSPDENQIIAGCAGGQRITLTLASNTKEAEGKCFELRIKGLAGGHSGEDIHRGRANANKLLGRILLFLCEKTELYLHSVNGGTKDNAIPREARATLCVRDEEKLIDCVNDIYGQIKGELCEDDFGFELSLKPQKVPAVTFDREGTRKTVFMLATVEDGVFQMNNRISGLVEFSRNLGVVKTNEKERSVSFTFAARSPKASLLEESNRRLRAYADMLGMTLEYGNSYPGWEYVEHSLIRESYRDVFVRIYGENPEIAIIHAGLECGIIKERIPDMDMISCGPLVINLHSPDEALNIASFERFFDIILSVLKDK